MEQLNFTAEDSLLADETVFHIPKEINAAAGKALEYFLLSWANVYVQTDFFQMSDDGQEEVEIRNDP